MASWTRKQNTQPYEIAEFIVSGILPIGLIVIGTLGNLLCIVILLNKENRRTSTNVYLIFLCIMDTLSLYQWNLAYIVFAFTDGQQKITNQSIFLCKFHQFLAFYTLHTSAMFLTLVSLDRACLLWSRWYKQKVARSRIAFIICIIILLILFGLNGFLFALGVEVSVYDNNTGILRTTISCSRSTDVGVTHFYQNEYSWVHLVIMYFVPFTLMFFCTILTVKKLIVRQILDNQQLQNNAQRNRRISIMLLFMCLAYIVLTLPNRLCFSVFANQIVGYEYTDTIFLSTNTLMYTRNALNAFCLYISVSGFRRDVRRLILLCWKKVTNQVVPDETNDVERLGAITTVHGQTRSVIHNIPMKTFHH